MPGLMVSLEFRLHPTTSAVRVIGHRHDNSGSSIPQSRRSQIRCHRTAGGHRLQPVLSIVFQAWMALCLSIRRLVLGGAGLIAPSEATGVMF